MKLVGLGVLNELKEKHADVRDQVDAWIAEVKNLSWKTPQDIKQRYPSASILGGSQVVFNIKGNHYRIVAVVGYKNEIVQVTRAGTHKEYDDWKL